MFSTGAHFKNAVSHKGTRRSFFHCNGRTLLIFGLLLLVGALSALMPQLTGAATGLVAAYGFDENGGVTAADASGNGNTATLFGGTTWVSGHSGSGLSFNGTSSYAAAPTVPYLANWTVSVWVRSPAAPSSANYSGPVTHETNYQLDWNHGSPSVQGATAVLVNGSWYSASFGTLNANTWYYLAATYDGETLNTYTNGVLITSNSAPSGPATSDPNPLTFGKNASSAQFFQGTIDDVRVYNHALTLSEIQSDMNTPVSGGSPPSGVVAAYGFGENGGSTAADASGNGNTATIFGGTTWVSGHSGSGLSFNGTSGYATAPSVPYLANWTVSVWVRSPAAPSSANYSGPVTREANYQLDWNHGSPGARGAATVNVNGSWHSASFGTLNANTWYYLAATYDGETLNTY